MFIVGRDVVHFEVFHAYACVCGDGTRDKGVTADDCVFADDGFATENGGASIDGDVIADSRVAFFAGEPLAASC